MNQLAQPAVILARELSEDPCGLGTSIDVAPHERRVLVTQLSQRAPSVLQDEAGSFRDSSGVQRRTIPRPGWSWPATARSSRWRVLSSMAARCSQTRFYAE
jgi:hypothetical protein